jgi:hypothetical protein
VPGEGFEPPTNGLQNRCSTPELTRPAGACALTAISVAALPQAVVGVTAQQRIQRTLTGTEWQWTFRAAPARKQGAAALSGDRVDLLQHVDQPGGGLQHRQPLRQLLFAEGLVEQAKRAPVAGMATRSFAERAEARDQRGAVRFELVIAPAEIGARGRCRLNGGCG